MTDAKIISLFSVLQAADIIMDVLNANKNRQDDDFKDMKIAFHGIEICDEETDETKDVFALVIKVEVVR